MVGGIYFIQMPYSDFSTAKGRPVLVFKEIDNNDILAMPLTTNLARDGFVINNNNLTKGSLKKESVIVIPKITAIDKSLIDNARLIAKLNSQTFNEIIKNICISFNCK